MRNGWAVFLGMLIGAALTIAVFLVFPRQPRSGAGAETGHPVVTLLSDGSGSKHRAHGKTNWQIEDPRVPLRTLKRLAETRALEDPVAAIEAGKTIAGHDLREAYLSSVYYTWGETGGEEAARWVVENLEGSERSDALYFAGDGWAEADPEAAAGWFAENTDGAVLEDGVWEAIESWGRKNPEAAYTWAKQLDDYTRYSVMDGLAEGWAAIDPQGAAEAALEMAEEPFGYDFMTAVATQWGGSDPVAAFAWSEEIRREDLREGVLAELGAQWALRDPAAAAAHVSQLEDAGDRRFAMSGIAGGWSEHDPGAALEWTLSVAEEPAQLEEMVDEVIFNWTIADPRGAAQWLREAEPGEGKDVVLKNFSASIFAEDPVAAVSWAAEISDSAERSESVKKMLAEWFNAGGENALQEIRDLAIPAEIKNEFFEENRRDRSR